MNFDKSLITTKRSTNTIEIERVGIGEPLKTDKFQVLPKQVADDNFGSIRISTMVDISDVEDHKLHTICRNLVSMLKQSLHGDYEILVKGEKVEVMYAELPDTVYDVSCIISISHKTKKVAIKLKLYQENTGT